MRRRQPLPELLAPAGGEEALYAAVEAGADALYLGMAEGATNARVGAENFTREQLDRLIPYCHGHGVKVYVTVNTLCYDEETADALSLAAFLDAAGADGVIVADLGVAKTFRKELPRLPLHASTQAFAHSVRTADALYDLGFSRVVVARELDKENLSHIIDRAKPEIEYFLHGALCVCHSGQCLFSSMVGGRSGNRGACAQPCRLPYGKGYPLSLCDLSLANHIPSLIDSGVSSLKIEGRMKSPSYVYGVTSIYRKLLDERRCATREEAKHLEALFSRSGFTDGYYTKKITSPMTGIRRDTDKARSREAAADRSFTQTPLPVVGEVLIKNSEKATFSLHFGDISVKVTGDVPQKAEHAALDAAAVEARFSKLGGTLFTPTTMHTTVEEGLFLPVGAQNALRRKAADELTARLRPASPYQPPPSEAAAEEGWEAIRRTAVFYREDTFLATDTSLFDLVFLPFLTLSALPPSHLPAGVMLPPVLFDDEENKVLPTLRSLRECGVRYALVSSLGQISLAKEAGLIPFGDFRLNILNRETAAYYRQRGIAGAVLSPELPTSAARKIGFGSYLVYGRVPLMLTERCFIKESFGCEQCGKAALTDRKGVRFPIMREYPHRNLIFNSLPTYIGDALGGAEGLGHHFIFTDERAEEVKRILTAYQKGESLPYPVRRAFRK